MSSHTQPLPQVPLPNDTLILCKRAVLRATSHGLSRNHDFVEECTQVTLVRFNDALQQRKITTSVPGYIATIARHVVADLLRERDRERRLHAEYVWLARSPSSGGDGDHSGDADERTCVRMEFLKAVSNTLTPTLKEYLRFRLATPDYSHEVAGTAFGVRYETVAQWSSRLTKAVNRMHRQVTVWLWNRLMQNSPLDIEERVRLQNRLLDLARNSTESYEFRLRIAIAGSCRVGSDNAPEDLYEEASRHWSIICQLPNSPDPLLAAFLYSGMAIHTLAGAELGYRDVADAWYSYLYSFLMGANEYSLAGHRSRAFRMLDEVMPMLAQVEDAAYLSRLLDELAAKPHGDEFRTRLREYRPVM